VTPRNTLLLLLACLLVCTGGAWFAFRYDAPVREAVVTSQGKGWKKSADYQFHSSVRRYGDWPYLMLFCGVFLVVAWKLKSRKWMRIIVAAMLASTIAGIIANASRLTTGRTRPRESPKLVQGFYGPWKDGRTTIGDQAYNSFPSGHTATAFGLAGVVLFASPLVGIAAMVLAAMVGWSSIMMGTHHPSDVLVSIILSMTVAWIVWQWMRRYGDATWAKLWQKFGRKPKI
jgi:membrane-associated phospholipid phosphatase